MLDNVDVSKDRIDWLCAACGADSSTKLSSLVLGSEQSPDVIVLPACACGAVEHLFRTFGEVDTIHRRTVNAVAGHLRAEGKLSRTARQFNREGVPILLIDLSEPITDLTGRQAAKQAQERAQEAQRQRAVTDATRAVVVRLGLSEGERPPLDEVQAELDRLADPIDLTIGAV